MSKKLTYKDAETELESLLSAIENNEIEVDELTQKIKRASELLNFCREKLRSTEESVNKLLDELDKD